MKKEGGWTEMWIRKFQGRYLCKMKNKIRRYAQKHSFTGVGVNCNYRTLIRCTSDDYWTV